MTAKATLPTDGSLPGGKLVWLQNPGTPEGPWPERVIMEGPDVFFRIADLDGDGRDEIVATQFFTERLTLLWNDGDYGSAADWRLRVIDDTLVRARAGWRSQHRAVHADAGRSQGGTAPPVCSCQGAAFDVRVVDLNKDGKMDVVIGNKKGVFVFLQE